MTSRSRIERRTVADLDRALASLASFFGEDVFVVVGSQGVLVGWDSTPDEMRNTPEIDIYLARAALWQARHPEMESSDFEIEGLFGRGSPFANKNGFHIDGVSPETATLPTGWQRRVVHREIKIDGRRIVAIAPCVEDLAISKMRRLEEKDRSWIEACNSSRGLDRAMIFDGLKTAPFDEWQRARAIAYVASLPENRPAVAERIAPPEYPVETHAPFWSKSGLEVVIRAFDPETGLFIHRDNPLGPAVRTPSAEGYWYQGQSVSESKWRELRSRGGS